MDSVTDLVQPWGGRKETWNSSSQPGLTAANKQMGTGLVTLGMGKPSLAEPVNCLIFQGSQVLGSLTLEKDQQQLFALLPTTGLKCKA